jgi:hypothetical protein
MSFFHRKKAVIPPVSSAVVEPVIDTMTHVGGVGRHQAILAGPVRRVRVELMPWEKGDTITAKIDGERVGELSYSTELHRVLLAMRKGGLPPVVVDGEVRRGDILPRYLAVALPEISALKAFAPEGWEPAKSPEGWAPAENPINVHRAKDYQDSLRALYKTNARRREAQVTFRTHVGGKYDGKPEGVIVLDGQVIGELSPTSDEKWSIIHQDRAPGIAGRLMVIIVHPRHEAQPDSDIPYYTDAVYRRTKLAQPESQ